MLFASCDAQLNTAYHVLPLQAAAIGVMYLSTMAGAVDPAELAMYAALLMDSDNSEMIEFLMVGVGLWEWFPRGCMVAWLLPPLQPGHSMTTSSLLDNDCALVFKRTMCRW